MRAELRKGGHLTVPGWCCSSCAWRCWRESLRVPVACSAAGAAAGSEATSGLPHHWLRRWRGWHGPAPDAASQSAPLQGRADPKGDKASPLIAVASPTHQCSSAACRGADPLESFSVPNRGCLWHWYQPYTAVVPEGSGISPAPWYPWLRLLHTWKGLTKCTTRDPSGWVLFAEWELSRNINYQRINSIRKYFFIKRVVTLLNSLRGYVVEAESLGVFKTRFDIILDSFQINKAFGTVQFSGGKRQALLGWMACSCHYVMLWVFLKNSVASTGLDPSGVRCDRIATCPMVFGCPWNVYYLLKVQRKLLS